MDGPSAKRFKAGSGVVDLTLNSDSDSEDDDIVITGVRQIGKPTPTGTSRIPNPLANGTGAAPARTAGLMNSIPAFQAHASTHGAPGSSSSHLHTPPQHAHHAHVNQVPNPAATGTSSGIQAADRFQAPGTTGIGGLATPASQPRVAPQKVELKTEGALNKNGLIQHVTGSLEVNNHFFTSIADVTKRERELLSRLEKYKRAVEVLESRRKLRPDKLVRLKTKKDQLMRMGISEDNIKVQEITNEMKKLSNEAKDQATKEKEMKIGVQKSKIKLAKFVKEDKPQLVQILQAREKAIREKQQRLEMERRQKQLVEQQLRAQQNQLHAMAMRQQLALMGGYDDDDDDENEQNMTYHMRRIHEMEARQRQRLDLERNQASLNRYTTNAEDLIHLLESVKKQEEQEIDGESNTPDELLINLLKHQRIGLKWMEDAEDDKKKRGGILADAMGLGKTVQTIALIMAHKAEKNEEEDATQFGKTTLIVAPVSLINQWKGEIETKVKEATGVKILMYHSMGSRKVKWDEMKEYDIVMTSYGTLSSELNKHCMMGGVKPELKQVPNLTRINQLKSPNEYSSPFYGDGSKFYRVVLDEAQQIKNKFAKVSVAAATLSSFYRWCLTGTPMQNNVDELYPLLRFLDIRPYNVEINFRSEIANILKVDKSHRYDSFDKERAIKRLRILMRSVMLRREKDSKIDGKPILDLPKKSISVVHTTLESNKNEHSFYKSIEEQSAAKVKKILSGPIARGDYSYIFVLLLRLRQACLHSELVRIGDRKKGVIYDDDGNVISTATVESMCKNAEKYRPEVVRRINEATESGMTCPICQDDPPLDQLVLFYPCGHGLCKDCAVQFFENFQEGGNENVRVSKCTTCRMPVKENELVDYEVFDKRVVKEQSVNMIKLVYEEKKKNNKDAQEALNSLKVENLEFSPKIADCIKLLQEIWSKNSDDKVIIFSHFTSFFSILVKFLAREGIECLEYLGSMNADARDDVVKEFYRNPEKKLMLISLKAGNSGLTLTCANHVIIMDPFWNPYVEAQAQDRCHRIGQEKPVTVHRMLIKDTVEDRILELQRKKEDLIESALDPTGMKEASKLSRNDIANLFGIGRIEE